MNLNEIEVNNYLKPFLGRYEDSFQEAWVGILECNPQTLEEITPIIRMKIWGQTQTIHFTSSK